MTRSLSRGWKRGNTSSLLIGEEEIGGIIDGWGETNNDRGERSEGEICFLAHFNSRVSFPSCFWFYGWARLICFSPSRRGGKKMMVCVMKMLYFFLMKKQLANCRSFYRTYADWPSYLLFFCWSAESFIRPQEKKRNIWKLGVVAPNVW